MTALQYLDPASADAGDFRKLIGLPRIYTPEQFGAAADGVTNDTAAIQAAIDAASTAGRGIVAFGVATYIAEGLQIPSYVSLMGFGSERTTIKLKAASTLDLFISVGFSGLTGTGSTGGVAGVTLSGLKLDGNKANATSNNACLRKYGYRWVFSDIQVCNAHGVGIYSEWCNTPGAGADGGLMEDDVYNVRVYSCRGNGTATGTGGIHWRGPHDSRFTDVLVYLNTGTGIYLEGSSVFHAGGIVMTSVHAYANTGWGVKTYSTLQTQGASVIGSSLISESNGLGGILLSANASAISGASEFYANTGPGIKIDSAGGCLINANIYNNTTGLDLANDLGNNHITLNSFVASGQQALTGTKATSTYLNISSKGAGTLTGGNRLAIPNVVTLDDTELLLLQKVTFTTGLVYMGDAVSFRLPRSASTEDGYAYYDATGKQLRIGQGAGVAARVMTEAAANTTDFASAAHTINTVGKYPGKMVWNYTSASPLWSQGSNATSPWVNSSGSVIVTPS